MFCFVFWFHFLLKVIQSAIIYWQQIRDGEKDIEACGCRLREKKRKKKVMKR